MKAPSVILFCATIITAYAVNLCPIEQKTNWIIERLLPHQDCDKFYQCVHGQPREMSCPKGTYFNLKSLICELKEFVDCIGRNIFENLKPKEGDDEKTTVLRQTDAKDNNIDNTHSKVVEPQKPNRLVIEFLPNGCPADSNIDWLLPHEIDCNLFYHCVWGEKELRHCPPWLHFNSKLQVCDWPSNAGCIQFYE